MTVQSSPTGSLAEHAVGWCLGLGADEVRTSVPDPSGVLAVTGLLLLADASFARTRGLAGLRCLYQGARRSAVAPSRTPRAVVIDPVGAVWQEQAGHLVELAVSRPVTPVVLRHLDAWHALSLPPATLDWNRRCWARLAAAWAANGSVGHGILDLVREDPPEAWPR
ncbi:hypothetical protein JOF53_006568 [Crossiella equi]|uniref:Uncharacterized protein n=1 Tax=Crossiella equi TaxID=130796 RepID=A0ABS5AMR2_9PSEU|nr:hypothetical protein [Crossiella equi]MBP2477696.1 hypothetical protein [Crossiella equi]